MNKSIQIKTLVMYNVDVYTCMYYLSNYHFFVFFYSSFTIKMTRTEALNVWLKDVIESQNVFDKQ